MKNRQEKDWGAEYHGWQKSGLSQRKYSEKSGYSLWTFKNGMTRTGCREQLKKSVTHTELAPKKWTSRIDRLRRTQEWERNTKHTVRI